MALTDYMRRGLVASRGGQILAFVAYTNTLDDVIKFTIGEPDFNTPDHIKRAAKQAIDDNHSHYANPVGISGLRQAASDFLAQKYQQHYNPETEIVVTNGVTEGIYDSLMATLNLGDVAVVPTPIFPLYLSDANRLGAEVVQIDTSKTDFKLTPAQLQAVVDQYGDRLRVLVMNYPTNPTGVCYTASELGALAEVVRGLPIFVLCDEIYSELSYDQPHSSLATMIRDQAILLTGVSKAWAMTGYRIGIVCAPAPIAAQIAKIHQMITTSEPTPMQDAAEEAFRYGQDDALPMKAAFEQRRDAMYQALTKMGFACVKPAGAFYIFAKIPAFLEQDDCKLIYELAEKAGVAVSAGSFFAKGGEGYLRFSYATGLDQIDAGMKRLAAYLQQKQLN
ncbi:MAG: aminotransferase class I/II-fold pyridoxal phosphate-dependent enzyme [Lactobacillus sp.]